MHNEVKNRILEIFEKHRKNPGNALDEQHFLDYLLADPKYKGAFRNSFSGLRRFNAFWNEIQLEFKVCFQLKDRDKNYSLGQFTDRVIELANSAKSSLAALRHQMKQPFDWNVFIIYNLLLLIPIAFINSNYFLYGYFAFIILINAFFIKFYLNQKSYLQKLFNVING